MNVSTRNFGKSFREFHVRSGDGVSSMTYEPTIPSNFLLGTDQGGIVKCRLQSKQTNMGNILLDSWTLSYPCKVLSVERNPFYPKYFLTVTGQCSKIWCEDIKTEPIISISPARSRLTSAAWCSSRISMFFTANNQGFLEIRDFLISHSSPVLQIKIADYALHCVKVLIFYTFTFNISI